MMAVVVAFYLLIASNENGKSDAGVNAKYDTATSIYDDAHERALAAARRIARDVPFSTALQRNDIEALQTRAADLQRREGAERVVIARGANRAIVDVGGASANLPAKLRLEVAKGRSPGRLEVSVVTPREYADRVKGATGLDVLLIREGGGLLASTLARAQSADIPLGRKHVVEIGGEKYTTFARAVDGFLGEQVKIAVLSPRSPLSDRVARNRLYVYLLGGGFLLLAATFAMAISRSLQSQMRSFLHAARQIGAGEFDTEVPPSGNDEFALVGVEFNRMADQLRRRDAELKQQSDRLYDAMRTIGETFASNLHREALLEIVVRAAVDGVNADAGRASVRPTLTDPLEQVAFTGDAKSVKEAIRAVEAKVLETGEPSEAQVDDV